MPRIFNVAIRDEPGPEHREPEPAVFRFTANGAPTVAMLVEALKLRREVENANIVIYSILDRIHRQRLYDSFVDQLLSAARDGMDSDLPDLSVGWHAIRQVQYDFVSRAGGRFRQRFIRRLSYICIPLAILSLMFALYGSLVLSESSLAAFFSVDLLSQLTAGAYVIVGIGVSVWLSAILRNRQLEWSTLTLFDPDGLPPSVRLAVVGAVTLVFCILLSQGLIVLGVGNKSLNDFMTQPPIAVIVGLIGGLTEDSLTKLVIGRIGGLTQGASPTGQPAVAPGQGV